MTKEQLIRRLTDIEWDDFEAKEAKSELPKSVWETVSAFANTSGGWIVLGVKQIGKKFEIQGVDNIEKLDNDFSTVLRGHEKFNVLIQHKVKKYEIDGKKVISFFIPSSEHKPVYFNALSNTFIRTGSGDQRANDTEINALLHDQSFGIRSDLKVEGYTLEHLDKNSVQTYRNRVRNFNPELPYNNLSDVDFFEKLGITVDGTLTYGGLLMLGKRDFIQKKFIDFWVDYLEIPGTSYADAKTRYTFRIQEQENLWEYYNVLIQRLRTYADNPFRMGENGFAYEDSMQLDALREGLVNMLMHADYFGVMHSTIRVYTNRIVFQNAGRFYIDIAKLGKEAISKPRNPVLARTFRWAKLAETAGFGIDKMLKWKNRVDFETQIDYSETIFELDLENEGLTEDVTQQATEQVTEQATEQATEQVTEQVNRMLSVLEDKGIALNVNDIMGMLSLKHRPTFLYTYLQPALEQGYIIMEFPHSPNHPKQRYCLTEKGKAAIGK